MRIMTGWLLAALLLTACSAPKEPPPNPSGGMVTIRLLDLTRGGSTGDIIGAFYREVAHVRVEPVAYDPLGKTVEEARREIAEMTKAGKVDLVAVSLTDAPHGLLLPLDPLIQKSRVDLAPYGPMVDQLRRSGQLYTLPFQLEPTVMIYNKRLVAEAGVSIPADAWTWEQFREATAQLTNREKQTWGFSSSAPQHLAWLWAAGRTGGKSWLEQEGDAREMLRLFGTMVQSDRSLPPLLLNDGRYTDLFADGQAAITLRTVREVRRWGSGLGFEWEMAPVPSHPGAGAIGYNRPVVLGIAAESKQVEAAWEFVRFAAGPIGARHVARSGTLPAYRSDEVGKAWQEQVPPPPPSTALLFDTAWAIQADVGPADSEIARAMTQAIYTVLTGRDDWEGALKTYSYELNRLGYR